MSIEIIAGRQTGLRRAGRGEPALLIHCSLAHSGAWSGVMKALENCLEMVAVDIPGHGATEFDASRDIQDQAVETAVVLLERFGRPAHLVGHSFGATVALRLAIERPDLVASLSLFEPVYFSLLAEGDPAAYEQEMAAMQDFADCVMADDWSGAADAFLKRWGEGMTVAMMPEKQRDYVLERIPLIVANNHSIIDVREGGVTLADVARVSARCLLMEGERSPATIHRVNDLIAAALPDVRRRVIKGAGHMGPITHAAVIAGEVSAFLGCDQG